MGACPEDQGFDRGHDHFLRLIDYADYREAAEGRQMIVFSPNVSLLDVRNSITDDCLLFHEWSDLIQALRKTHGAGTRVAVFPYATMQVEES